MLCLIANGLFIPVLSFVKFHLKLLISVVQVKNMLRVIQSKIILGLSFLVHISFEMRKDLVNRPGFLVPQWYLHLGGGIFKCWLHIYYYCSAEWYILNLFWCVCVCVWRGGGVNANTTVFNFHSLIIQSGQYFNLWPVSNTYRFFFFLIFILSIVIVKLYLKMDCTFLVIA